VILSVFHLGNNQLEKSNNYKLRCRQLLAGILDDWVGWSGWWQSGERVRFHINSGIPSRGRRVFSFQTFRIAAVGVLLRPGKLRTHCLHVAETAVLVQELQRMHKLPVLLALPPKITGLPVAHCPKIVDALPEDFGGVSAEAVPGAEGAGEGEGRGAEEGEFGALLVVGTEEGSEGGVGVEERDDVGGVADAGEE
jgi:hypothetical protein